MTKKIKHILLIKFIFLIFISNSYSVNSNYNKQTIQARELIFDFKFKEANLILNKDDSPISFYLQSYSIFLENLLIGGEKNFNNFESNLDLTIDKLKEIEEKDSLKNILISEVYLQSAIVKLMNRDFISGSFHFIKSHNYFSDSEDMFPNLLHNKKLSGLYKIIAGITPDKGKKFLEMIGLEGDLKDGFSDLNSYMQYAENKDYLYVESFALHKLVSVFFKEDLQIKSISKCKNNFSNNSALLFTEILKNYKFGEFNNLIINAEKLSEINNKKEIPILYYFSGIASTTINYKTSISYLFKYISTTKNKNFIKASNWQLARIYLLNNNAEQFNKFKQLTIEQGTDFTSADKQAVQEAEELTKPNTVLLKVRLLFDAQKYDKAYTLLMNNKINTFNTNKEKAEYLYRLGRIEYKRENYTQAKINFLTVLKDYRYVEKYFIPYSSLELAYIFKEEKNIEKQKYYLELALYLNKYGYSNSIKQKANNALKQ